MSNPTDTFDAYITSSLEEPPLADDGFSQAIAMHLTRRRRHQRSVFVTGGVAAALITLVAASLSPSPWVPATTFEADSMVALLVLVGLSCVTWVVTEAPLREMRQRSR
jgi:hypothetical protein